MNGDFVRFMFEPARHYNRVLQQQGRVLLDADWNEPGSIKLRLLRALAMGLVGPAWAVGDGCRELPEGVATLRENPGDRLLSAGASIPLAYCARTTVITPFVLWLDIWERHISAAEATGVIDLIRTGLLTQREYDEPDHSQRWSTRRLLVSTPQLPPVRGRRKSQCVCPAKQQNQQETRPR